jgi:hypothetical protein
LSSSTTSTVAVGRGVVDALVSKLVRTLRDVTVPIADAVWVETPIRAGTIA